VLAVATAFVSIALFGCVEEGGNPNGGGSGGKSSELVGRWIYLGGSNHDPEENMELFKDGTGVTGNTSITWKTENKRFILQLPWSTTVCDYKVSGSRLTLTFDDNSRARFVNKNNFKMEYSASSFTDSRDGKMYKTVRLSEQVWMAENLNHRTSSGSWCYGDDDSNCNTYGRLYDWNTAKTACPNGWHLPSKDEWNELVRLADIVSDGAAGKKLKSKSGWNNNGNGTDDYGFSALPGGNRDTGGSFGNVGGRGNWWTATEGGGANINDRAYEYVYYRYMGDDDYVDGDGSDMAAGYSVRCVESGGEKSPTYAVTVSSAGTGATSNGSYAAGATVNITAGTAPTDQRFKNWTTTDGVTFANGNSAATTFIMPAKAVAVEAVFEANTYKVTISSVGAGASGDGDYVPEATVTISAGVHPEGHSFEKWRTSSSGVIFTDSGSVTTAFIMPEAAVTVTAVFERPSGGGVWDTLIDGRDGKRYKTATIGGKRWMAENLNYKTTSGSWCYNDDELKCNEYGRLYDWAAAMGLSESYNDAYWGGSDVMRQGVCPSGWHLPNNREWKDLVETGGGWETAGTKLKSRNGWYDWDGNDRGNGTDDFGFSALPGGAYFDDDDDFYYAGIRGYWRTATEYDNDDAYFWDISYNYDYVSERPYYKSKGYSVRCVEDERLFDE